LLHLRADDHLVDLVRAGDGAAFDVLYERHSGRLLEFCGQMLGSEADAEEALRHSFAAARFYIAGGGREVAFEPWLYTIAGNHCLTVLRDRRATSHAPVEQLDEWRRRVGNRRRRRFGLGLPAAPAFALEQGVAAVGGPGVVAKAAVIVGVLASGAGVTTEALRENGGGAAAAPMPAQVRPQVARADCGHDCGGRVPSDDPPARTRDGDDRAARRLAGTRADDRTPGSSPRKKRPAAESPGPGAAVLVSQPTGVDDKAPVPTAPAPAEGAPAPGTVVEQVVSKVRIRRVKEPALPKVGKDGSVTLEVPTIDRRSLHLKRRVQQLLPSDD
jgi:hypothetical protein